MLEQVSRKTNEAHESQFAHQSQQETHIRVLVVDDHEVVRRGICAALDEERDFEVVGQANTAPDALRLASQLRPDIVLLDVFLGPGSTQTGLDIAHQLQRALPETRIVIFTGIAENETLLHAMRIGVHGYLQKAMPLQEMLAALRAIYRGERVVNDPQAMTQVLNEFNRLSKEPHGARDRTGTARCCRS